MSTGYQIKNQEGLYYLTFQVVGWVDVFTRQSYRDIIIENYASMDSLLDVELSDSDFLTEGKKF